MYGFEGIVAEQRSVALTLYTDAYVIRGRLQTRQHRVTDILNEAEHSFIVLTDVVMDEYGSRQVAMRAEYAQINLAAVLFAVADEAVQAVPELRTPKVSEQAMISIPPFRITGRIHLLPERDMREALEELVGRFLPVTEAAYWSEAVGEARTTAPMVAVNHARAQILAPHRDVDPWAGLDRSAGAGETSGEPERDPDAIGEVPLDVPTTSQPTGSQDPWRDLPSGSSDAGSGSDDAATAPGNPWGGPGGDPWAAGRPRRDDELIG